MASVTRAKRKKGGEKVIFVFKLFNKRGKHDALKKRTKSKKFDEQHSDRVYRLKMKN